MLTGLIFLAAIVGAFCFMGFIGYSIIGPMDRAARNVRAPPQFFTVDLFGLVLLLQFATAPSAWMMQATDDLWNTAIFIGALAWVATISIWWASIRSLSRAGVGRPLKRLVFSTVILPFTLACIMGVGMGNIALISWVAREWDAPGWLKVGVVIIVNLFATALIYAGRRTTLWILANPTLGQNSAAPLG